MESYIVANSAKFVKKTEKKTSNYKALVNESVSIMNNSVIAICQTNIIKQLYIYIFFSRCGCQMLQRKKSVEIIFASVELNWTLTIITWM